MVIQSNLCEAAVSAKTCGMRCGATLPCGEETLIPTSFVYPLLCSALLCSVPAHAHAHARLPPFPSPLSPSVKCYTSHPSVSVQIITYNHNDRKHLPATPTLNTQPAVTATAAGAAAGAAAVIVVVSLVRHGGPPRAATASASASASAVRTLNSPMVCLRWGHLGIRV